MSLLIFLFVLSSLRCFKAVMFFTGFIFASIVVYLICLEEAILPVWSNALIALSAGLLFGLITLLVQYVGLFMLGFHSGLLLAIVGLCAGDFFQWAVPPSPWASVGILLLAGLALALLNLCFQVNDGKFCIKSYCASTGKRWYWQLLPYTCRLIRLAGLIE